LEFLLIGAVLLGLASLYSSRCRIRKPYIWFEGAILRPEDLFTHADELAKFHKTVRTRSSCNSITLRLKDNFSLVTQVYKGAAEDLRNDRKVAPAAEWLLDNYYVIEEQVREILLNVRRKRFKDLPVLSNGQLKGTPRIYAVALELIAHTDGSLDENLMVNFINAYQDRANLSISEIWSLSLMVRIALMEKIRHSCALLEAIHGEWRQAEDLLTRARPEKTLEKIEAMNRLAPSFVEHMLEILRHDETDSKQIREALAAKLLDYDTTMEKVIQREHQATAAQSTSLGNAISSLKNASTLDWNEVFEALCPVDKILRADGVYREMDFESRNYYRRQVQLLAKKVRISEARIARLIMESAQGAEGCQGHCGYYLLDKGRKTLYEKLGRKLPSFEFTSRAYILTIAIFCISLAGAVGFYAYSASPALATVAALSFLLPGSEVVLNLLNLGLAHIRPPAFLPKFEYLQGIPQKAATLVVVPALLTDTHRIRELVERLEVHYLANPESNLYFALLGDLLDAPKKEVEGDRELCKAAREGIETLNQKYGEGRFLALVRHRSFSQTQRKWMGWERKRGALVELNKLLSNSKDMSFSVLPSQVPIVRYVLTLDADTRLPMDMAKKLVGTISHPLNQVEIDEIEGRVIRGYGVIQPRIGISVDSVNQTLFARVMAGYGGTDTYTTAISDIYQDWFGQGIFTGKGIYDLNAAELLEVIPENSVLSHDLLEGGLMHTGLATDLELVDDFPSRYSSYMQRQHRWTRGDWQLLGWLKSKVADSWGQRRSNPLTVLTRWQIFDNLRRSLIPLSLILFLIMGLTVLPGSSLFWAGMFIVALVMPQLLSLVDFNWGGYVQNISAKTHSPLIIGPRAVLCQIGLHLTFLPYQAWVYSDAILRTLFRLISRKNLLEWTTAAEVVNDCIKRGCDYNGGGSKI